MSAEPDRSLRVLVVLDALASANWPRTLTQLAQNTGVPKTTLLRLLDALEAQGFVTRIPGRGGYVTGPQAHRLGLGILAAAPLLRACRAILQRLVETTGETCNLNALAGDSVRYLVRVESQEPMRLQLHMDIGAQVPLHCTASGKLFLALMPQPLRDGVLDRIRLDVLTPKTIVRRDRLAAALDEIRAQELGIDDEEFIRGMVAIAVPVRDAQGSVIAALACHAPTAQASLAELLAHGAPMRAAAGELARLLSAA